VDNNWRSATAIQLSFTWNKMRKIINIILILLLAINVLYVFTGVLLHPLQSEDAIGIWLLKAKAFYIEGGFPNQFLHNANFSYSHQQYPLGLPFFFFLIYQLVGGVKENIILLIYPFLYIAIVILTYKVMRKKASFTHALVFTYVYSMLSPLVAAGGRILAGNADIFIVFIEWLIIYLLYKKVPLFKNYIFITFLVMIASQIKLEGVFLSIILLFLPITKKYKLSLFTISLVPFLLWLVAIYVLRIPSDTHIMFPNAYELFIRLIVIVSGILKELININNWYFFWPLVGLAIFIKEKLSVQMKQILLPSYGIMMILYILVYVFSSTDTYKYVNSSFDRILFQHSAIIFLFFLEKTLGINFKNNLLIYLKNLETSFKRRVSRNSIDKL
jgi:hypothetical protein